MYIRWNRTKRSKDYLQKFGDLLSAVLVESIRIDRKPRQKVIKYLGGVDEKPLYITPIFSFWRTVDSKLDELNLAPAVRKKIVNSIEKRIPRPSNEDYEKEQAIMNGRLKELQGITK